MIKGIDVSHHQKSIDFTKVKNAGIEFVIIRAGYGKYISQKDRCFESNYAKAKEAGLKIGAYWYSYAKSTAEAEQEAQICLQAVEGKKFDLPIFYDIEEKRTFNSGNTNSIAVTFMEMIKKNGYDCGLYMSRSPLNSYINKETQRKYPLWIAEYNSKLNYSGDVMIWQYSSTGKIEGVNGNVDLNEGYFEVKKAETSKKKTNKEVAQEVIAGKWGNGSERMERLKKAGYNYSDVQAIVNSLLYAKKKSNSEIATEVILGKWGNGAERKKKLTAAGYDYSTIQKIVNERLK